MTTRLRQALRGIDGRLSSAAASVRVETQAALGFGLWFFQKNSRSMVHLREDEGILHPYGSRWVQPIGYVGRICSHCRSMHPLDFVKAVEDLDRWKPGEAYHEMMSLIQRGENAPSMHSLTSWQHAPDGYTQLAVLDPDEGDPRIQAHTFDCMTLSFAIMHMADITSDDFEYVAAWMKRRMPEVEVVKDGFVLTTNYDPRLDPMLNLPAPIVPIAIRTMNVSDPEVHDEGDDQDHE